MIDFAKEHHRLIMDISLPDPDIFISPDVEQCIYWVAHEAVANVIHHAHARIITFWLAAVEKDLELIIQDNGIGLARKSVRNPGTLALLE